MRASALLADVTDEKAVNAALEEIEKDGRPLELAIYNAGNNLPEKFLDVTAGCLRICGKSSALWVFGREAVVPLMLKLVRLYSAAKPVVYWSDGSLRARQGSPLLLPIRGTAYDGSIIGGIQCARRFCRTCDY